MDVEKKILQGLSAVQVTPIHFVAGQTAVKLN
jgi:hypothetical protein